MFAVNAGVYVWSNQRRSVAMEELRDAITRQVLLSSIQLTFNDAQKQVGVMSQVATESGASSLSGAEREAFSAKLAAAERKVEEFRRLLRDTPTVIEFQDSFRRLAASWRIFFDNFGIDQTKAIEEIVVHGEPLSRHVIEELMPRVQAEENQRAETASANFRNASRISDEITFAIFIISTLVALVATWLIARDISFALSALKAGAAALGSGQLDHRIRLHQTNELGDLANAFDQMSAHLAAAQKDLTAAHELEKKKSDALAHALVELNKTQDRLVVQQKLASLGSLTAGIAHEIKNPLNFITNFAGILRSLVSELQASIHSQQDRIEPAELEFIRETLGDMETNASKIQEHGKRADEIVKGMLMHSRGQSGQAAPTDLNSLVSEYVKLAYHGLRAQDIHFNVSIEEDYDSAIGPISVWPHDLSRVILNVANNGAWSASQKAKRLGADGSGSAGFKPVLRIATRHLGNEAEIRIRDNGDGVPDLIRDRIFEPFFTTKPAGSGTGLGLSMSYEIVVQQHRGHMRVESQPGEYAEFIITLPMNESAATAGGAPPVPISATARTNA